MLSFSGITQLRLSAFADTASTHPPNSNVPYEYVTMALEALADHGLDIRETDRLLITVRLALESRDRFFASAYYDPTDEDLDEHFADFVVRSVRRLRRETV
jgi:hypothetical protein